MPKKIKSDVLERIRKTIPIETRIRVALQAHFIYQMGGDMFIHHNEKGEEIEDGNTTIQVIAGKQADELAPMILKEIEGWVKHGCPPPHNKKK